MARNKSFEKGLTRYLTTRLIGFVWLTLIFSSLESARAQQLVLPVSSANETSMAVAIDSLRLTLQPDSTVGLDMLACLIGKLPKGQQVDITACLCTDSMIATFPAITIYGKWAYYHYTRSGEPASAEADMQLREAESHTFSRYTQSVAYQPWMNDATLTLTAIRADGCGNELAHEERTALRPTLVVQQRAEAGWRDVKSRQARGTAYIVFPVNQTTVLPDFRGNSRELSRLCHVIDSINHDENVLLNRVSIRGFASPEGTYANNERLARERTNSLARYLAGHCGLPLSVINVDYVPEDWEGLRRYIDSSTLAEREVLLGIIDSQLEPDLKLATLSKRFPAVYKQLSDEVFPLLRHTDYEIDYTLKSVTEHKGAVHSDTLSFLAMDSLDAPLPQTEQRISYYRPWIAVKTNLLLDAALAPNIEVEIPLGRSRWSLMLEDWFPWFRISHNAKGDASPYHRSDQRPTRHSYQALVLGAELRYWFAPRCNAGRPTLCGTFVGLYGAGGKYDIERRSTGDQGEFTSFGLTIGHSWPISRHWNLELSGSIGYVGGPQRHYEAEFDDARLIFRNYDNLRYIGPTKLKVSLSWLAGRKRTK